MACGYWPLFRDNPYDAQRRRKPLPLDSPRPTVPFRAYALNEIRYKALQQTRPETPKCC